MSLFAKLFHFVILSSAKYNIDESHGLKHSMEVLQFAHKIHESEKPRNIMLESQDRIIYTAAIIHDMCDKKYVNEKKALRELGEFLEPDMSEHEISIVKEIVSTMSYSKVKVNGFPKLGPYMNAYHIVREADLLAAYDFDRCMIYNMNVAKADINDAFENANDLFERRVLRHNDDGLFITNFAKEASLVLHEQAIQRIGSWRRVLRVAR
jgi:HD superfamily phosphodiesterase